MMGAYEHNKHKKRLHPLKYSKLKINNSLVSKDIIHHDTLSGGQELIVLISPAKKSCIFWEFCQTVRVVA
jgi:hypothetical protein